MNTGAGFPPGPKNFISMFSLWAAVGGDREMGKWCGIKRKRLIEVWLHPQVRPYLSDDNYLGLGNYALLLSEH